MTNIMKFTKEQVLEKIKATLGKTQKLSDRTILDTVTNTMAMFADDSEMELDIFVTKITPTIQSMNTNFNDEQGKFVKDYEKKHPAKKDDDDDDANKGVKGKGDDEMPQWYKDELARRAKWEKEQEDKVAAIEGGKRSDELRTSSLAKFKDSLKAELERNPKISERLEKRYAKILAEVGSEDTVDTLVARLTEKFNDAKELAGDGYIPSDGAGGGGNSGGKPGANDSAVDDALESIGVPRAADKGKGDGDGAAE